MERDASLQPSYGPVTRPSHEPDQITPTSILFLEVMFYYYYYYHYHHHHHHPSICAHVFPVASFPQVSPHNPVYISPLPHTCQTVHPPHSSRFDYSNSIWCDVQVMKLYAPSHSPMFPVHLGPNIFLKNLFSGTSDYVPASL